MDLPDETVHHGSHRMNNTQKKQQMGPFLLLIIQGLPYASINVPREEPAPVMSLDIVGSVKIVCDCDSQTGLFHPHPGTLRAVHCQ